MSDLAGVEGFTPGPWWAVIGDDQPVAYYRGVIGFVSTDPPMAICTGPDGDKSGDITAERSEWEANARLMALAPTMYAELSRLRTALEEVIKRLEPRRKEIEAIAAEAETDIANVVGRFDCEDFDLIDIAREALRPALEKTDG